MLAILKSIILFVALTHRVAATTVAAPACVSTADTISPQACEKALGKLKNWNPQLGDTPRSACGFCEVTITNPGDVIKKNWNEVESSYKSIIRTCGISPGSTRPGSVTIAVMNTIPPVLKIALDSNRQSPVCPS